MLIGGRYGSFARSGATTYDQAVSDTVGFTEALALQVARGLAETTDLTEAQIRQVQQAGNAQELTQLLQTFQQLSKNVPSGKAEE